tara:strand:- start:215 stop:589 length:375 start_codon:yes stop_codon:yes gene_type:complete
VLKQAFYLFLLGFALIGMASQSVAKDTGCSSHTENHDGNSEMPDCNEMEMEHTTGDLDHSSNSGDCCGSDCATMQSCSPGSISFMGSWSVIISGIASSTAQVRLPIGNPVGVLRTPEIRPPISI